VSSTKTYFLVQGKLLCQSRPLLRAFARGLCGGAHPPPGLPALLRKLRGHTMELGQVPEQHSVFDCIYLDGVFYASTFQCAIMQLMLAMIPASPRNWCSRP
jgi:hypothetical protein